MKNMKKILALLLCVVMLFSLAACSKKGEEVKEEQRPEFVYSATYTTLSEGSDSYFNPRAFAENGFYSTNYEKVGENIPEGVIPVWEGQYDVYEYRIYFVGDDGSITRLENYAPLAAKEYTEGKNEFYSSSDIMCLHVNSQGKLVVIENRYSNWLEGDLEPSDPNYWNNYVYEQEYFIRVLDSDGSEISSAFIDVGENEYLYAYSSQLDAEDNVVVALENGGIMAIAPDGSVAYTVESDYWIENIVKLPDGSLGATTWGEQGMELLPLNTESGAFGEPIKLPDTAYYFYTGGGEYDLYYTSGINFYGLDIETGEETLLFNWINCDVNGDDLSGVRVMEDGSVVGFTNVWDDGDETYTCEMVTVKKVPYDSVPHKETLTLACMYLDWQVRGMVIDFNRSNEQYRIEVIDYSQYNTEEDYNAGMTKLNTEIMAGNVPDIICLNGLPYRQLASKGILADLYGLMETDSEIKREDYFPNILGAMEINGGLYSTVSNVQISSVLGASSVVGDEPGWTYDEFNAALAGMPEGCTPFDVYTTRGDILRSCLALDMDSFVDWGTGKVSFDSQEFIDILEFSALFPAEFNWENYEWTEEDSIENRIAQGRQMLMNISIYSFDDIKFNEQYFGGMDTTYVGFPTNNGTGNMLMIDSGYAISANCEHKEAAWQFVRQFFTEEYQEDQWTLPSHIGLFEKKLDEAMTPEYVKDAEGNYILDEEGNRVEQSMGAWYDAMGNEHKIYALSAEQAEDLMEIVTTTTKVADYSDSVFSIVIEQAEAFFQGQKSAEEVAKLIQSKANIYVNEQR